MTLANANCGRSSRIRNKRDFHLTAAMTNLVTDCGANCLHHVARTGEMKQIFQRKINRALAVTERH